MTTFSSKQQKQQAANSMTLHDQKQLQQPHHSNPDALQEQPHGSHQQRSFSYLHCTTATATKQTPTCGTSVLTSNTTVASDTHSSSYDNGVLEQSGLTDDDDVEIIMHNSRNSDNLSNDTNGTGTACFIPPPTNNSQHQYFDSSPTGNNHN